jgi:3-phosphoshikimate 1-carboxyvinyltransferase
VQNKESDRILAIMKIIQVLGGNITGENDGTIVIRPSPLHGGIIDSENDHRTAMSAAVLGLAVGDITITGTECVRKSFPEFWEMEEKYSACILCKTLPIFSWESP